MSVIHPGLFLIMRRFPAEKNILGRLYLNNPAFQTVCHDYRECENALDYWKHSRDERALERWCEYKELQNSLEQEMEELIWQGQCAGGKTDGLGDGGIRRSAIRRQTHR